MGIKEYDLQKSKELLKENDIIVEKFTGNGVRDFWFVFKKKIYQYSLLCMNRIKPIC